MQKDIKELASIITMNLVPLIFNKLNEIEDRYEDKIESWDFNEKNKTLTGKLKYSEIYFEENLD